MDEKHHKQDELSLNDIVTLIKDSDASSRNKAEETRPRWRHNIETEASKYRGEAALVLPRNETSASRPIYRGVLARVSYLRFLLKLSYR